MRNPNAVVLAILIMLFSIAGCRSNQEPTSPSGNKENAFFPLRTGNKWYYSHFFSGNPPSFDSTWIYYSREIKETKLLGDKSFYLAEEIHYDPNGNVTYIDTIFYCVKDDSLFCITDNHVSPSSIIEFRGAFSSGNSEFIVKRDSTGDYMGYPSNRTDSTIIFNYYHKNWMDSYSRTTFKKNIGCIESWGAWGHGSRLVRYELK